MKNQDDWNNVPDDLDDTDDSDDSDDAAAMPETSFPDPWVGDSTIEYWVWDGKRLIPTTPDQQARIQEMERLASTRRRMAQWEHEQRHISVRIRIVRGICQTIAGAWQMMARHVTRPAASPFEAHHAAMSAQHQQDER